MTPDRPPLSVALESLFRARSWPDALLAMARPHGKGKRTERRGAIAADFDAHVLGTRRLGLIPFMNEGGLDAGWGSIDLDVNRDEMPLAPEQAREHLRRLLVELTRLGVVGHAEASKSRGAHVWVFPTEPVPVDRMRALLVHAVEVVDPAWARLLDAVVPRGRFTGVGNGVWLPQCGADREPRTRWIDPETWLAFDDQLGRTEALAVGGGRTPVEVFHAFEPGPGTLAALAAQGARPHRTCLPSVGGLDPSKAQAEQARRLLGVLRELDRLGVLHRLRVWRPNAGCDRVRLQCPFHAAGEGRSVDHAVLFASGFFACMSCGERHRTPLALAAALNGS